MVPIEQLQRRVGERLPEGRFTIAHHEHWLTCDVIGADRWTAGVAHPMYPYYATLVGMGVSLPELLAMFDATPDDGVMAGETTMVLHRPLQVGATYTIPGRILAVDRKQGRRVGTFDLVRFRLDVVDHEGVTVATVENSFVFPRR